MRQGSFVRRGAAGAAAADPGTRPGLHGQTLLSSGHPDLDRLLAGGLPLGSLLLLLEDGWSVHHATLLRYFLAEGAACGQSLLLAAAPPPAGGLAKFVPAQAKGRSADKDEEEGKDQEEFKLRIAWQYRRYIKTGQPGGTASAGGSSLGMGSSGSGSGGGGAASSRAAAAASSPSRSSSAGAAAPRRPVGLRDWCHQFDLLKPAGEEGLQQCRAQLVDCSSAASSSSSSDGSTGGDSNGRLLGAAADFVQSLQGSQAAEAQQPAAGAPAAGSGAAAAPATVAARAPTAASLPPRGPQHVGRIAVLSLGSLGWQLGPCAAAADCSSLQPYSSLGDGGSSSKSSVVSPGTAVLRALLQLKALVRDRRCVAAVSVPAALFSPSDVARMQHIADCVIALESVADDSDIVRLAPDSASVAGLLHLRKLPSLGTIAPPAPEVALHLIRHRRRRLAISPVEIDPEAELAEAEAASGAGRSVASVLCGGPPAADRAIDF